MKIALLNDLHFGARSDSEVIAERQKQFFRDEFFPYLEQNQISQVFILGDVFEHRRTVDFKTLQHFNETTSPLRHPDMHVMVSSGNHDVYHKSSNKLNSLELLMGDISAFMVIDKPVELKLVGCWIGVIPWMTEANWDECIKFIETTSCPVIFGHFDIIGGMLNPGYASTFGLDPKMFNRFDLVLSGHYHTKSKIGNVHYLGTQYQMDWHDYNQTKGFHVFDTTTKTVEFIASKLPPLFVKATYPEPVESGGKYVKLLIPNPSNETEEWVKAIKQQNPIDVEIFEGQVAVTEAVSDTNEEADSVIEQVVDSQPLEFKNEIKVMMLDLYKEASSSA